jgi:hypothetical protein
MTGHAAGAIQDYASFENWKGEKDKAVNPLARLLGSRRSRTIASRSLFPYRPLALRPSAPRPIEAFALDHAAPSGAFGAFPRRRHNHIRMQHFYPRFLRRKTVHFWLLQRHRAKV